MGPPTLRRVLAMTRIPASRVTTGRRKRGALGPRPRRVLTASTATQTTR